MEGDVFNSEMKSERASTSAIEKVGDKRLKFI